MLVSAATQATVESSTANLVAHLRRHSELDPADVAYTLQVGRRHFAHRRMVVGRDLDEVAALLASGHRRRVFDATTESDARQVAFLLTGQGAQYVDMARALYDEEPHFRRQLDDCARGLKPHLGLDVRDVLYPKPSSSDDAAQRLTETSFAQPALFAIEYALAKLWMAWGVRPRALLGHSIGEYVAACLAGVFSLDDALKLVAIRGRLMQALPAGVMMAVPLAQEALLPLLGADLALAAVNAPGLCVVSGPEEPAKQLEHELAQRGVEVRLLHTSHAFHSAMMDPIVEPFISEVGRVQLRGPAVPMLSNVTGTWLTEVEATDPRYWGRHLRQTVRFTDNLATLTTDPNLVLLEVGPGNTLSSLARQQPGPSGQLPVLSSLRHPQDNSSDVAILFQTLGRLWLEGVPVSWKAVHADHRRRRVPLPTYPFQRERFLIEPQTDVAASPAAEAGGSEKTLQLARWFYVPSWRRTAPSRPAADVLDADDGWLVFVDQKGLGAQLVERLRSLGQTVTTVTVGPAFARVNDESYVIDPSAPNDYDPLIRDLVAQERIPTRLLHLWSVTGATESTTSGGGKALRDLGFYSLVLIAQALARHLPSHALRIDIVSNETQDVDGTETISADKSTLLGPSRVIPQEYPSLVCRNFDVEWTSAEQPSRKRLIAQLLAEFVSASVEPVIALRHGQRWVQDVEPVSIGDPVDSPPLREGGVYLITGGLGAVGLSLAKYLAETAGARLILTGRRGLPERSTWPSVLRESTEDPKILSGIEAVQRLEELGAKVLVLSADVADETAMMGVIGEIDTTFGTLHGVVHAAGIIGSESMTTVAELDRRGCQTQFRPKIAGLRVLARVLDGRPIDFCLLTSSLSSYLGGFGFAAYSAANVFMDAFAHEQNRSGHAPWIAVDWEGWQRYEGVEEYKGTQLGLAMTHDEGVQSFARILARHELGRVLVSTDDLRRRAAKWIQVRTPSARPSSAHPIESGQHARPNVSSTFIAPQSDLEVTVATIWQELLGIDRVGAEDNFFELGGHSLLATQVISRLREAFQMEVQLRAFFHCPTVRELAQLIEEILTQQIEALSDEEAEQQIDENQPIPGAKHG